MWNINKEVWQFSPSPDQNGMHAWHAASNAYLIQELGLIGAPIIMLGGIIHETPIDWNSWNAERIGLGMVNHIIDSVWDIVANVTGMGLGLLGVSPKTAGEIGNQIPRPGDPNPFENNLKNKYKGNPSDAW